MGDQLDLFKLRRKVQLALPSPAEMASVQADAQALARVAAELWGDVAPEVLCAALEALALRSGS